MGSWNMFSVMEGKPAYLLAGSMMARLVVTKKTLEFGAWKLESLLPVGSAIT